MYQRLILVGFLGSGPEQKYIANGDPVTSFNVATSRKYADKDETTWFRVTVWGKQAESCATYLHKGSRVLVEGRLRPDESGGAKAFQRKDGSWSANYEVTAEAVRFLTPKSGDAPVDQDVPF